MSCPFYFILSIIARDISHELNQRRQRFQLKLINIPMTIFSLCLVVLITAATIYECYIVQPRLPLRKINMVISSKEDMILKRHRQNEKSQSKPLSQRWYRNKQQNISPNQKRLISRLWPHYGIDLSYNTSLIFSSIFLIHNNGTTLKVVLDIGFGLGDSLVGMALNGAGSRQYIGCEIHRAGIASALQKIEGTQLNNTRIIRADAHQLLLYHIQDDSLDEICVFFPDPWPNTDRDGNRRIIRSTMIDLFELKMKENGLLRIATDVESYALHVKSLMETRLFWSMNHEIKTTESNSGARPAYRPVTKYESRAFELGNSVWDFEYEFATESPQSHQ